MKPFFLTILFLMAFLTLTAQVSHKIRVEKLKKPTAPLAVSSYDTILKNLILLDVNFSSVEVKRKGLNIPYNIIAQSKMSDSLVKLGYHPFFDGMYRAYADHRPFVLSPDMIWLLISQGFAMHVISNAEKLRNKFVFFSGKTALIVPGNDIRIEDPNSHWEKIFPAFTAQIAEHTNKDLITTLTSDFSTTTPASKIASQITIMDAMKSYFNFYVMRIACGIPSITLQGTTKDWQKVYDKAESLKKYDLDWWIDTLEPVLHKFINASKGEVDKAFWKNMFKHHDGKTCGSPGTIDGWIVKFFPYDKDGKRTSLETLSSSDQLPKEIVKVPLNYVVNNSDGSTNNTPLELWAGFVGLKQNKADFTLSPQIGWMIRKQDTNNLAFSEKVTDNQFSGLKIRVDKVPDALLKLKKILFLQISFTDSIRIPDEMKEINIETLRLNGKIDSTEINRLEKLFTNTRLYINDKFHDSRATH